SIGDVFITPQVIVPIAIHRQREIVAEEHAATLRDHFLSTAFLAGANDFIAAFGPDLLFAKHQLGVGSEKRLYGRRHVEHLAESWIEVNDLARLVLNHNSRVQVVDE